MQANRTDDGGCVVIDLKTRHREQRTSEHIVARPDRKIATAIYHEVACVIERRLPELPDCPDRLVLEKCLAGLRLRTGGESR